MLMVDNGWPLPENSFFKCLLNASWMGSHLYLELSIGDLMIQDRWSEPAVMVIADWFGPQICRTWCLMSGMLFHCALHRQTKQPTVNLLIQGVCSVAWDLFSGNVLWMFNQNRHCKQAGSLSNSFPATIHVLFAQDIDPYYHGHSCQFRALLSRHYLKSDKEKQSESKNCSSSN